MKLNKCNILIVGLGKSGLAALDLLYNKTSKIFLFDSNSDVCAKISEKVKSLLNTFVITKLTNEIIESVKLIVTSPGVPLDIEPLNYAKSLGIKIIPELELGFLSCKNNFLAITGTNGKTTATQLLGDILAHAKHNVSVVGNIGIPVCNVINKKTKNNTFVCEVSSFQLEGIISFRPKIAAVLNIGVDHLDWHKTEYNYIKAKYKIAQNLKSDDYLVLNANCKNSQILVDTTKAKTYFFDVNNACKGAYIKDGFIVIAINKKFIKIVEVSKIKLLGKHNLENVLCVALMAYLYKIKPDHIAEAIQKFSALPHRLQSLGEVRQIEFINDSKSTNISSCLVAINAISKPTHLILGGSDKGYEYDEIFKNLSNNILSIAAYGEVSPKISDAAQRQNYKNIQSFNTLKEATVGCYQKAKAGHCVLLSPASASFDSFLNYEHRGSSFKEYVKELTSHEKV